MSFSLSYFFIVFFFGQYQSDVFVETEIYNNIIKKKIYHHIFIKYILSLFSIVYENQKEYENILL